MCTVFHHVQNSHKVNFFYQILFNLPPNPSLLCTVIFMLWEHISCVANLMELLESAVSLNGLVSKDGVKGTLL